jgi:cation:H+ antiporter
MLLAAATSAPELFLNILSALRGEGAIGIGAILGANIVVIGLLFGVTSLISPSQQRDHEAAWAYPSALGISLFILLLGVDGKLERFEGVLLILLFVAWMFIAYRSEHRKRLMEKLKEILPQHQEKKHIATTIILFATSVALLFGGAELLIRSVHQFAISWNVSPLLLSALLIALGVSLPELILAVVTLFQKRSDIRTGTLFGSIIFNSSLILGVNALIEPVTFSSTSFLMLGLFSVVALGFAAPIVFNINVYKRLWSVLLLSVYAFFLIFIFSTFHQFT